MNPFRRTIPLLTLAQAMMMSSMSLIVTSAALVGAQLAPDQSLATLPLSVIFIAMVFTSIPAALLMQRIGRKAGFLFATLIGMLGGFVTMQAIFYHKFWWFLAGTALIGVFNGFGNYLRFAAADAVGEKDKSRAISYILAGGVIAAILGPNLANWTQDTFEQAPFAGGYAALIGLYLIAFVVLSFVKLRDPNDTPQTQKTIAARPLRTIVAQAEFIVALICGICGYAVMSLVMTATPLAMQHHAHPFSDTAFVIQWHVLGMFAPSFFTGNLIQRFGLLPVMFAGALLGLACVVINLTGHSVTHYWLALVLLGISWNFLFIGATTMLTKTYRTSEQAKVQATNDFVIFSSVTVASLFAGTLLHHFGWKAVNIGVVPMLVLVLASLVWLARRKPQDEDEQQTMEQLSQETSEP